MANAAILFSLIDNLEFVNYYIQDIGNQNQAYTNQFSRHYKREMFDIVFENDVRQFSETKESFNKFMSELYTVYFPEAQYYLKSGKFPGVSMNVQNAESSGVSIVFENKSENDYTFGEDYSLLVLKNGIWEDVPYVIENWGFNSIGFDLASQSESDLITIDWRWLYGELQDGTYRLQKKVLLVRSPSDYDAYNLAVDFIITSTGNNDKISPEQINFNGITYVKSPVLLDLDPARLMKIGEVNGILIFDSGENIIALVNKVYYLYESQNKTRETDTSNDDITDNDFLYSPEGVQFRITAYSAAKALLSANADELALYMIEPNESENAIRGLKNVFDDIAVMTFKFSLENSMKSENEILTSYEYALKGEDSYSYVTMSVNKVDGEWKIAWIGIEK